MVMIVEGLRECQVEKNNDPSLEEICGLIALLPPRHGFTADFSTHFNGVRYGGAKVHKPRNFFSILARGIHVSLNVLKSHRPLVLFTIINFIAQTLHVVIKSPIVCLCLARSLHSTRSDSSEKEWQQK